MSVVAGVGLLVVPAPAVAEEPAAFDPSAVHPVGAEIYRNQCVECHGASGEGVAEEYDEPLYGDRSLAWLTRKIERTMPEDAEDECVGEDAAAVAAYIYDAFYSPEAQARLRPRDIDPVRLTVEQHRNAIADLIGRFRWDAPAWPEETRGLEADYFETSSFRPDKERLEKDPDRGPGEFERIDPVVAFDFGESSPAPGHFGTEQFSIRWSGALLAPETGTYEFRLRTRNGARLYVNDREKALIDGWVSSGGELREETGSITLIGGRSYPIRIDFFKFKDKGAAIELLWKPPHGVVEIIPARVLAPVPAPESLVVTAAFPADDRSQGYERGSAMSKAWFRAATDAAVEAAGYVVEHLEELAKTPDDATDRRERLAAFCEAFAEAAFRRPITEEQRAAIIGRRFDEAGEENLNQAVKRVVLLVLTSPRFLYPELPGLEAPDAWDVASRLSFALWDSIPDKALLAAAADGRLLDPAEIRSQARRMLDDRRAMAKLRGFFLHWLEVEGVGEVVKDDELYPEFDAAVLADLRTSLELFVDEVVRSEASDYRQLLLADYLVLNERLAGLYGPPVVGPPAPPSVAAAGGFSRVSFDPRRRVGVLTHPFLLSAFAYHQNSSPIHRGVFLTRNIVGRALKPPPEAIEFKDSMFEPGLTMREKVTQLTRDAACMSCHSVINPLGFSLEHYDAIGRWRTTDNDRPVDPTSDYTTDDGVTVRLEGARDVAEFAVSSRDAHEAFVRQFFHHIVKQPDAAYRPGSVDRLRSRFAESGFHIRDLAAEIAVVAAARGIEDSSGDVTQR